MNTKLRLFTSSILATAAIALVGNMISSRPLVSATSSGPTYVSGNFTFAAPQQLIRPPIPATPGVTLLDQDVEPEIKVDLSGNIYVTAIHGVPGGVDLWKSTDGGTTFVYLGEPDGAQDKCNVTGTLPCTAGAGGGDDSIDVSS